jgi:hypothetical protein
MKPIYVLVPIGYRDCRAHGNTIILNGLEDRIC